MQRKLLPFFYVLIAVPFFSPNEVFGAEIWKLTYLCPSASEITQEFSSRDDCNNAKLNLTSCTIVKDCAREGDGDIGTITLDASGYSAGEDEGQILVTAGRTGGTGDVRVFYYVEKVTCNGECNFRTQSGDLHWPSGDTNDHIFSIQLTDDDTKDGNDIGTIILKDEAGEVITSATLTVVDDESENEADCVDAGYTCTSANECDKQSSGHTCSGGKVCCMSKLPVPKLGEPKKDADDAEGLVPCGDNITVEYGKNSAGKEVFRYTGECAVCHFQRLIDRGLDFLVAFGVAFAALLFVNAGMLYATASANASNVSKAHKLFTNALTGLVLILAAYLLIDVVMKSLVGGKFGTWNELLCEDFSPWYEVEKMSTIILESEELVLPEIEKVQCEVSQANGGLGGACSPTCLVGSPVSGAAGCAESEKCCIDNENKSYGSTCTLTTSGYEDNPGTCTTMNACGENHSEINTEQCGSNLVCCNGIPQGGPPPAEGYCSPEYLRENGWPEASLSIAGCVCKMENGGNVTPATACVPSRCDTCADGTVVSYGIWQINLDAHALGGNACPSSIEPDYGTCPKSNVCCTGNKKQCTVVDADTYGKCKNLACDPAFNSSWAANLHAKRGWQPWTTSYNKCVKMGYK